MWESTTSGRGVLAVYRQDHGPDLYRRGLYTFIKLTVPPPQMIMFDASNRDQCEVKRSKTNTPLQALIMMNEPGVLEAARVLAQNLTTELSAPEQRITMAFRKIICRQPSEKEKKILSDYYTEQFALFQTKKLNAALTLKAGEYPQDAKVDANQAAALMKVITMIYNLEEAITKT
jgi:hypothetical protein